MNGILYRVYNFHTALDRSQGGYKRLAHAVQKKEAVGFNYHFCHSRESVL